MDTEVLVALVLLVTQVSKSWIQEWFARLNWKAWMSVALSFLASYGVVFYNLMENQLTFDLWPFVVRGFAVFALANGGKKLLNGMAGKIRPVRR